MLCNIICKQFPFFLSANFYTRFYIDDMVIAESMPAERPSLGIKVKWKPFLSEVLFTVKKGKKLSGSMQAGLASKLSTFSLSKSWSNMWRLHSENCVCCLRRFYFMWTNAGNLLTARCTYSLSALAKLRSFLVTYMSISFIKMCKCRCCTLPSHPLSFQKSGCWAWPWKTLKPTVTWSLAGKAFPGFNFITWCSSLIGFLPPWRLGTDSTTGGQG